MKQVKFTELKNKINILIGKQSLLNCRFLVEANYHTKLDLLEEIDKVRIEKDNLYGIWLIGRN